MILFLDEVASPAFAPYIPKLFKPMTEAPLTIIACAVRIKAVRDRRTGKLRPGLPADFRFRFPNIDKTTSAPAPEFVAWLQQQCQRYGLQVDDLSTLELIRDRSLNIAGQALRPLRRAAFLQVPLTRSFVEGYIWDAE